MVATATARKPLGQLLLGRGLIQPAQLERALDEQRRSNHQKLLGEIFVELHQCSEEQVAEALAESYGIPFARVSPKVADPKVISVLPRSFLEEHKVLPLFLVEGVLTVAVPEPANVFLLEEIGRLSGHRVQVVAATVKDITATLKTYLPGERVFVIDDVSPDGVSPDTSGLALIDGGGSAATPADKLVSHCLYNAVRQGASEVHIEPACDALRVRYRIDGRLAETMRPPLLMHAPVVERLKAMAGLDPDQRDLPQEGVVRVRIDRRPVDLRVCTLPARGGEKVAVRILESERPALRLEKLGFGYDTLKQWRKLIGRQRGLLLVTGPAGAGKATTLYSVLRELDADALNVGTVEQTIACALPGVSQMEIGDRSAGLTAPAALHALMRQGSDVLMIDTLADAETARLAIEAAMTGHLVLSSLPAPDAPAAVARLLQMGAEPYAVAAALAGVLSQRLVRKLCGACKEAYQPAPSEVKLIEKWAASASGSGATLYRPRGCAKCHDTGYAGRMGVHELLVPDDDLLERIGRGGCTLADLREWARAGGMKSLRADGLEKVKSGITTLDEVYRAAA